MTAICPGEEELIIQVASPVYIWDPNFAIIVLADDITVDGKKTLQMIK